MGLFDRLRKTPKPKELPKPTIKTSNKIKKTDKEIATERGEPYVAILKVELDPENIGAGAFELDWNDKFIANLVRAGYQLKPNEPEDVIVDRWFATVCRNVVLETFEQSMADPDNRLRLDRRDLGNGRTEIG